MQINREFMTNNGSYSWCDPQWVCLHYTGGLGRSRGETAENNAIYYQREGGDMQVGAHYFVGDDGIYASTPEGRGAWTQGNYNANTHCISIEVVAGEDEAYSEREIELLQELVPHLMRKYGIPATRIIRHYDVVDTFPGSTVDPHKRCPAAYIDKKAWVALKAQILEGDDVVTDQDVQKIVHGIWEYIFKGDGILPELPHDWVPNTYNMLRFIAMFLPELVHMTNEYEWPPDTTEMPEGLTKNMYDKARASVMMLNELLDRMDALEQKVDQLLDE